MHFKVRVTISSLCKWSARRSSPDTLICTNFYLCVEIANGMPCLEQHYSHELSLLESYFWSLRLFSLLSRLLFRALGLLMRSLDEIHASGMKRLIISVFAEAKLRWQYKFCFSTRADHRSSSSRSPESWRLGPRECVYIAHFLEIFWLPFGYTRLDRLCVCVGVCVHTISGKIRRRRRSAQAPTSSCKDFVI